QEESSSETTFSMEESFNSKGDWAKWSSSIEYERIWSVDADIVGIGAVAILEDSGSESFSESSGEQTYTPKKEEDPKNNYNGRTSPIGEGGNGDGEGQNGENAGTNAQPQRRISNPGLPKDVVDLLLQNGQAARGTSKYKGIVGK